MKCSSDETVFFSRDAFEVRSEKRMRIRLQKGCLAERLAYPHGDARARRPGGDQREAGRSAGSGPRAASTLEQNAKIAYMISMEKKELLRRF